MSQVARELGLTREGLYKSLSMEGKPSFDTIVKVLRIFGLRLCVRSIADDEASSDEASAKAQVAEQAG